jgi:predicted SAM-dependent methyltransferase
MNIDFFNKEYLLSEQYIRDMMVGYNGDYNDFIHSLYDAEPKTDNYNIRHFQLSQKLGGWRWKGIFTYRETFANIIFNKNLKGIDFGGSQRPISSHIDIVDIEKNDYYQRPVKYNLLEEVEYDIDFIFSSHTLEHIPNLEEILEQMYDNLVKDGILALNLPSYSCKRWWANTGNWMGGTPHVHTFKLKKTKVVEDIPKLINIDELLEKKGFNIALAEYSGDNNIIIFAEK